MASLLYGSSEEKIIMVYNYFMLFGMHALPCSWDNIEATMIGIIGLSGVHVLPCSQVSIVAAIDGVFTTLGQEERIL